MVLTREEIRQTYRALLNRDPESEDVIKSYLDEGCTLEGLIRNVAVSPERMRAIGLDRPATGTDPAYQGLHAGNEDLLECHLEVATPEAGFVKNFLGVKLRSEFVNALSGVDGTVYSDIPTRQIDYHAAAIEFVGTLKAVEASGDAFVMAELGAGWGSWSIISGSVARRHGRRPARLYAVEGSPGKTKNLATHYRDNGFEPSEHTIVNAVVGARDGFAFFPECDVTSDWGAEAIFSETFVEQSGYDRVRSISIETLLAEEQIVDLIHCDIQGAEGDVIESVADFLSSRVRYLVIGTHGRSIEGRIIDTLLPLGWVLENESPASVGHSDRGRECLQGDGTQVWRNPRV